MSFPHTNWSQLAQASWHGDTKARAALEEIILRYRSPLVQFGVAKGLPQTEAEDAVQEFLAHLAHDSVLRRVDPERGKFRNFLIGSFKRFLHQRQVRESALKRGGGERPLSLDAEEKGLGELVGTSETESSHFDRFWALAILENALSELESEYSERGREEVFSRLLDFLPGGQAVDPYEEVAATLSMPVGTFKSEVHRARERLRNCLRGEILKTVSAPHEVEEELAYLGQVLAGNGSVE